jgi:hypothetical protein
VERVWSDAKILTDLKGDGANFTFPELISQIRANYEEYVDRHSSELINFYLRLEDSCRESIETQESPENKWHPVMKTTSDMMVKMDKKAITWKESPANCINQEER